MATPLTASAALSAFRAEGLRVVQHGSWRTHNRGSRGTGWGPVNGVMIHHTAGSGDVDAEVGLCYRGRSDLPGPLCHGVIAKDGTLHLVGWGRANHAGLGDDDVLDAVIAERATPAPNERNTDGNSRFYGFECINRGDGKDPWPEAQLDAIARASAALLRAHGWHAASTVGHKEWTSWKVDPRGFSMDDMRARVAERLKHGPDFDNEEDEFMALSDREFYDKVWRHDGVMKSPWGTEENPTWMPESILEQTGKEVKAVRAELAATRAVLDKLADAVGSAGDFDVADLKAEIRAAVAEAVESVDARVTLDVGE